MKSIRTHFEPLEYTAHIEKYGIANNIGAAVNIFIKEIEGRAEFVARHNIDDAVATYNFDPSGNIYWLKDSKIQVLLIYCKNLYEFRNYVQNESYEKYSQYNCNIYAAFKHRRQTVNDVELIPSTFTATYIIPFTLSPDFYCILDNKEYYGFESLYNYIYNQINSIYENEIRFQLKDSEKNKLLALVESDDPYISAIAEMIYNMFIPDNAVELLNNEYNSIKDIWNKKHEWNKMPETLMKYKQNCVILNSKMLSDKVINKEIYSTFKPIMKKVLYKYDKLNYCKPSKYRENLLIKLGKMTNEYLLKLRRYRENIENNNWTWDTYSLYIRTNKKEASFDNFLSKLFTYKDFNDLI